MKKIITSTAILVALVLITSCGGVGTYYEQFTSDKAFVARVADMNKTIDEIRALEKGKLIRDDINLLKYVYEIGKNDTYQITYQFDEKGCYEIGIDGYFEREEDAQNVVNGIKANMENSEFGKPVEDNYLSRWQNSNGAISVELDYKDTAKGLFIATIFANE